MGEPTKKPKVKFKAGSMSTAIWENEGEKDGEKFAFKTVSLQRSFQDKEGNWKNPDLSLRVTDIPKAILVLQEAYANAILGTEEAA